MKNLEASYAKQVECLLHYLGVRRFVYQWDWHRYGMHRYNAHHYHVIISTTSFPLHYRPFVYVLCVSRSKSLLHNAVRWVRWVHLSVGYRAVPCISSKELLHVTEFSACLLHMLQLWFPWTVHWRQDSLVPFVSTYIDVIRLDRSNPEATYWWPGETPARVWLICWAVWSTWRARDNAQSVVDVIPVVYPSCVRRLHNCYSSGPATHLEGITRHLVSQVSQPILVSHPRVGTLLYGLLKTSRLHVVGNGL